MVDSKIDTSIQQLITMFGDCVKIETAWENASPGSAFAAQRITVNTKGFDFVDIVWLYRSANNANIGTHRYQLTGKPCLMTFTEGAQYALLEHYSRAITLADEYIEFDNAIHKPTTSSSTGAVDNNYLIPYQIHVGKGVK